MKTEKHVGDLCQLPSDVKQDELKLEQENFKICGVCEIAKPFCDFYLKHKGLDNTCKSCRCVQRKKRYNSSIKQTCVKSSVSSVVPAKPMLDKPSLLTPEDIKKIAEAMLILEGWQMELDTQRDLSNSNLISTIEQK